MRFHVLSTLAVVPILCLATPNPPQWDDMRPKHYWSTTPEGWEWSGPPPTDTTVDLYVALRPHRKNALIDALHEVSTPGNPKYRAYLSREKVAELVAPHTDTLKLVHAWLEYRGVPSSSVSATHNGGSLKLTGVSLSQANDLLGASYQLYRHIKTNETMVRTLGYALPATLHGLVDVVSPTSCFNSLSKKWEEPSKRFGGAAVQPAEGGSGEPVTVPSRRQNVAATPSFLRWLYSTWGYEPVATNPGQNAVGIVGFNWNFASMTDLRLFMDKYRSDAGSVTFTATSINSGYYDADDPSDEANMDMQYSQGLTYPTRHIFLSVSPTPPWNDWYFSWLDYMLDPANEAVIPQTISLSYGNEENSLTREYAERVCLDFAQLGALGVSLLVASGNTGVGQGICEDAAGNVQFEPNFPGSCPYVTAVGGTVGFPEVGASFSNGGFSNYFERPAYQQEAVSSFLQVETLEDPYKGKYNISGRGIPDVSAQSLGFRIFLRGQDVPAWGTSGAAPIVAGIISLLNDHLIAQGDPPLGFLNPYLYGRGRAGFNDIISGSNPGCGTTGFSAITGWDPITGLGTPDFEQLLYILDLAEPEP